MWPQPLNWWRCSTLPVLVTFTRLAVPRWVLILGTGGTPESRLGRRWLWFVLFGVGSRGEFRRAERHLTRREDHEHVLAFEPRFAFDRRNRAHVFRHAIEQPASEHRIRDLATAKHDRDFYLAAVHEEPFGHSCFDLVIVSLDLRSQLDFSELEIALLLASVFIFFRLFVFQSSVIADPADGWSRRRRDFDQVEAALSREGERVLGRHDAELCPVIVDDADATDS